jgi:hypothetical protein
MASVVSTACVLLLAVSFSAAEDSASLQSAVAGSAPQPQTALGHGQPPEVANNFPSLAPASASSTDAIVPIESSQPVASSLPSSLSLSPLPDAPSVYKPLSGRDKFNTFLRQTYSPYTAASALYETSLAQLWGQWYQYGGGMQGWGKRLGATLADTESRRFIQTFMLATILHQDPRYFACTENGLISRAWYAGSRVLITRTDAGSETFNSSEVFGTLLTSSLQNAYYPRPDRGWNDTLTRFAGDLSSDATSNLLREFEPDMKRIFRRHEPEKLRQIESRLPKPMQQFTLQ